MCCLVLALAACNSPKKFDMKTADGFRSLPETLHIVGIRGVVGGMARNPVSGSLRCMHQATTFATNLLNPGMANLNGASGPPVPVANRPGMDIAQFEAELDRKLKPARARRTVD